MKNGVWEPSKLGHYIDLNTLLSKNPDILFMLLNGEQRVYTVL